MIRNTTSRKSLGAYYTHETVADFLVGWAVRSPGDAVMDPSFGGGVFLRSAGRRIRSLGGTPAKQLCGVEVDADAHSRTAAMLGREFGVRPSRLVQRDFFELEPRWRAVDAVVGNPPFIRYQRFSGRSRGLALRRARSEGVKLSELCSSWAPFLVHAVSMVRRGGRLAMVVPFEMTHAAYARPVLSWVCQAFAKTTLLTFQHKAFPDLSEDTLLVLAEDRGGKGTELAWRDLRSPAELQDLAASGINGNGVRHLDHAAICRGEYRFIKCLLPRSVRDLYDRLAGRDDVARLGDVADVGIGYVSGANDFFHMSPEEAAERGIPRRFLTPAVRRGKALTGLQFTKGDWTAGLAGKQTALLLHLNGDVQPDGALRRYLEEGRRRGVANAYKCRVRSPWYCVPHVCAPDAFLTYMNGKVPKLVANTAGAVAPNNLHMVRIKPMCGLEGTDLAGRWYNSLTRLSVEIEGHALGGGMLKLEPSEARRVCVPLPKGVDTSNLVRRVDRLCRAGRNEEARELADRAILIDGLHLSQRDCAVLAEGANVLLRRRYERGKGPARVD